MRSQKFLMMLLGHPGSGKSYFSRQLAEKIGAARINGDAMRMAMFGSFERAHEFEQEESMNPLVFGALDYAAEQILASGVSVIYDAQHNQRSIRLRLSNMAKNHNAVPIVVWIQTPDHIALQRGQEREATQDQQKNSQEMMEQSIKKHKAALEPPTPDEVVIHIDGTLPFEQQYEAFVHRLATI